MKVVLLNLRDMLGLALSFSVAETRKSIKTLSMGIAIVFQENCRKKSCFGENKSSALRARSHIELFQQWKVKIWHF